MGEKCIHLPVVGYIYFRERERERERERVSSACGGIWVFIIYKRKVSVLFGFICEKGIHLPVVGYIYISEREREREREICICMTLVTQITRQGGNISNFIDTKSLI